MAADLAPNNHSRSRRRLPQAAFLFVVLALIALALAPALLLERISAVGRDLTTILIPTYDRLRVLALTMERQSVAMRGFILSGDPRYVRQFTEARTGEIQALQELDSLVRRIGPTAAGHGSALRELALNQHDRNLGLMEAGADAYRGALPQLEATRDSMLLHLAGIEQELLRVTETRIAEEADWAQFQRGLSFLLGVVAVFAALLVGWFARRQGLLTQAVERALREANQARLAAEARREQLERVTESRARLMRGFSHDVKNPLGAASGYLQLLGDGVMGPLTERQAHSVERASKSITGALHLVEDLLELARAESGNLEITPVPTDICAVVREAAEEFAAQAEAKGLDLTLQLPESSPWLMTDGNRVRQILGNLISNAVKYTPTGGVTVRLEAASEGGGGDSGRRLAIQVIDTGPGIPPEQRHLLFEEFVRLHPGGGTGAGVGLTISQRIARALGGEITMEGEVGEGSTFILWLPARPPPGGVEGGAGERGMARTAGPNVPVP